MSTRTILLKYQAKSRHDYMEVVHYLESCSVISVKSSLNSNAHIALFQSQNSKLQQAKRGSQCFLQKKTCLLVCPQ